MINRRFIHAAAVALTAGVLISGCDAWSEPGEADTLAESTVSTNSIGDGPSESVSQGAATSEDDTSVSKTGETYPGAPFIPELMTMDGLSDAEFDFYPCLEIPMDFFEELGLEASIQDESQQDFERYCLFNVPIEAGRATLVVRSAPYNIASFESVPDEIEWSLIGEEIPLVTNQPDGAGRSGCTASVDTSGGSLSASFQMYNAEQLGLDSCDQATFWLTEILRLDGKIEDQ